MVDLASLYTVEFSTMEAIMLATLGTAILGGFMATGRAHINRRVDLKLEDAVDDAVTTAMAPLDVKLDAILINVAETSAAVGRVHDLEVIIKNGLSTKVASIETDVRDIRDHLIDWNGTERRTT